MNKEHPILLPDLTAIAIRALVLYCLAEYQSGDASTIRVTVEGASFSISDNGRGHSINKNVDGTSYLSFIYTHFDYPFESGCGAPVQLQGIGMSLVNALCGELHVTVKKRDGELRLHFRNGELVEKTRITVDFEETGITLAATIAPHLCSKSVSTESIEEWLLGVLAVSPSLTLFFNGRQLQSLQHAA